MSPGKKLYCRMQTYHAAAGCSKRVQDCFACKLMHPALLKNSKTWSQFSPFCFSGLQVSHWDSWDNIIIMEMFPLSWLFYTTLVEVEYIYLHRRYMKIFLLELLTFLFELTEDRIFWKRTLNSAVQYSHDFENTCLFIADWTAKYKNTLF